jgi:hypothetical protein
MLVLHTVMVLGYASHTTLFRARESSNGPGPVKESRATGHWTQSLESGAG